MVDNLVESMNNYVYEYIILHKTRQIVFLLLNLFKNHILKELLQIIYALFASVYCHWTDYGISKDDSDTQIFKSKQTKIELCWKSKLFAHSYTKYKAVLSIMSLKVFV